MNSIRTLAFFAAVLITVFLMRVIADSFPSEPTTHAAIAAHGPASSAGLESVVNRSSR
jgi:hypothetical protein